VVVGILLILLSFKDGFKIGMFLPGAVFTALGIVLFKRKKENYRPYRSQKPEVKRDRNKGESLLTACDDYVVIDIETTGFSPSKNDIIEISAIRVTRNEEAETFTTLCRPREGIPKFIEKMTGITNEMVSDAPEIGDVIGDFVSFIGNSIVVGHNVNFDINFIYDNYDKAYGKPFDNDFIDTLPLARKLFPEMGHHRLGDMAKRFRINCGRAHRSLDDCRTTHLCYQKMKTHL
jgi:DNA polymerase-3 subunit epsilon